LDLQADKRRPPATGYEFLLSAPKKNLIYGYSQDDDGTVSGAEVIEFVNYAPRRTVAGAAGLASTGFGAGQALTSRATYDAASRHVAERGLDEALLCNDAGTPADLRSLSVNPYWRSMRGAVRRQRDPGGLVVRGEIASSCYGRSACWHQRARSFSASGKKKSELLETHRGA